MRRGARATTVLKLCLSWLALVHRWSRRFLSPRVGQGWLYSAAALATGPAGYWCLTGPAGYWCPTGPAGYWCPTGPAGYWCLTGPAGWPLGRLAQCRSVLGRVRRPSRRCRAAIRRCRAAIRRCRATIRRCRATMRSRPGQPRHCRPAGGRLIDRALCPPARCPVQGLTPRLSARYLSLRRQAVMHSRPALVRHCRPAGPPAGGCPTGRARYLPPLGQNGQPATLVLAAARSSLSGRVEHGRPTGQPDRRRPHSHSRLAVRAQTRWMARQAHHQVLVRPQTRGPRVVRRRRSSIRTDRRVAAVGSAH
jgi:hypothetical protein